MQFYQYLNKCYIICKVTELEISTMNTLLDWFLEFFKVWKIISDISNIDNVTEIVKI